MRAIELEKKREREKQAERELVEKLGKKSDPKPNNLPPLPSGKNIPPKKPVPGMLPPVRRSSNDIPPYRPSSGRNSSRDHSPARQSSRERNERAAQERHYYSGNSKYRAGSSDARSRRYHGGSRPMWWGNY